MGRKSRMNLKFPIQWQNMYDITVQPPLLSQQSVFFYQQKYEIELFLKFFSQLREIEKTGKFDKSLTRFRDKAGKFRKGNLIKFFLAGFKNQPNLLNCLEKAYSLNLRNIIGHNEYRFIKNEIVSIDSSLSLSENEFGESLFCIQSIQNLVYWFLAHNRRPDKSLGNCGVLGCHFIGLSDKVIPAIAVIQLSPFFLIDKKQSWLNKVSVFFHNDKIITQVGELAKVDGPLLPELPNVCKGIAVNSPVVCRLIPVMPFVGKGDSVFSNGFGEFVKYGEPVNTIVDFEILL